MSYETIRVRFHKTVCFLQLYRPDRNNAINRQMVTECHCVLDQCSESATVVVLEGMPEVFSLGADFVGINEEMEEYQSYSHDPEPLFNLWQRLSTGPFISIAHIRGKANAGGLGFIAASDIVLADESAQFGLSELLFGLLPACVLPFLVRRVGIQRATYLTLSTRFIPVQQAHSWGLVDAYEKESDILLHSYLARVSRISPLTIRRVKKYLQELNEDMSEAKPLALAASQDAFSDSRNLAGIRRYVETGLFPWEE